MEIDNDLGATLDCNAMGSSSATRFLREAKFPSPNPFVTFSKENLCLDDSNEALLLALTEQSFISIRQLSGPTHLPPTMVYRRLMQSLRFHVGHLRSVPHRLTRAQKWDRVELLWQLLSMFEIQRVRY
jgi:hypothetical protein